MEKLRWFLDFWAGLNKRGRILLCAGVVLGAIILKELLTP